MRFFKIFFASLLALITFVVLLFIVLSVMIGKAFSSEKVIISPNGVLVLETGQQYREQRLVNPLGVLMRDEPGEVPGLFQTVRLLENAATDDNIKGIYLKVNGNPNGAASTEELRNAILRFKASGKFVYAYGEVMDQNAYYLATAANKVYLNPKGGIDFTGFSSQLVFLKGTLDKLEIKPEIFYCGKYKSATEPLRETQMTEANRIQTTQFLGEMYGNYLTGISRSRNIDTATLHGYANQNLIQEPADALKYKLVDALKYDDEVMAELKAKSGTKDGNDINMITLGRYNNATFLENDDKSGSIAIIYAQGDIVGGHDERRRSIASEDYVKDIRKAREDKNVKAIVFRVNSGGGSALASEVIWRELTLAKKAKPVVVSMGDYAASGGYYISCMADSIFAQPNTLTGSIGVFGVMFNMQDFFKDKIGVTFDGVKTAPYADLGSVGRPLTEAERKFVQNSVDSTYATFKSRVVAGRKLQAGIVDSIAQGRVWSGTEAQKIGLVDRIGGINDALECAAKLAKLSQFGLKEFPEVKESPFSMLVKSLSGEEISERMLKKELGAHYDLYKQIREVQDTKGGIQAKMPFRYNIH
jgi:protease-4